MGHSTKSKGKAKDSAAKQLVYGEDRIDGPARVLVLADQLAFVARRIGGR